jgi:hypothetical protein
MRDALRLTAEKIPFLLLVPVLGMITLIARTSGGGVITLTELPISSRLGYTLMSYVLYVLKFICPIQLSIHYPHPVAAPPLLWVFLSASVLLIITLFSSRKRKDFPYLLMGWLWFLTTLLPVIGIVQIGTQLIANRYTYLPYIGLFIMAVWGLDDFFKRVRLPKELISVLTVLIFIVFGLQTKRQVAFWQNTVTLFEEAVRVDPTDAIAHLTLGYGYYFRQDWENTERHSVQAIQLKPMMPMPYGLLAAAWLEKGMPQEAIHAATKALELGPPLEDLPFIHHILKTANQRAMPQEAR